MKIPLWYVLTGGPSSGKTTVLKRLAKLGYHTVPEAARALIDKYVANGTYSKKLREDKSLFQKKILEMELKMEKKTPRNRVVFFDRGVPDSVAYYKLIGFDTKRIEKVSKNRYKKIFFFKQLPFKKDYARTEDKDTVKKLDRLLPSVYKGLGYEVIRVPAVSIEKRVEFVLSRL